MSIESGDSLYRPTGRDEPGPSVAEQHRLWAEQAVREWDGVCFADLFDAVARKHGVKPPDLVFDGREPTTNERHLWNLLSWRDQENRELGKTVRELRDELHHKHRRVGELVGELQVLVEQLEVASDRSESWKNLCTRYKELAEARGEKIDMERDFERERK
jgi:hypothetical protein